MGHFTTNLSLLVCEALRTLKDSRVNHTVELSIVRGELEHCKVCVWIFHQIMAVIIPYKFGWHTLYVLC